MALIDLPLIEYTEDVETFYYKNNTVYGSPEENRNVGGEYVIAAHVDLDLIENFITVISSPYLSKLSYTITNDIDGHYRFERLRFPLWSGATAYIQEVSASGIITTYANLVFYSNTNKFYKAKISHTNIAPDSGSGLIYWEEITDFTVSSIRMSDKIVVFAWNTIYDARGRKCVKDELYKISSDGCGCTDDLAKMLPFLKRKIYLLGARAKSDDDKCEDGEKITRILENLCPKC